MRNFMKFGFPSSRKIKTSLITVKMLIVFYNCLSKNGRKQLMPKLSLSKQIRPIFNKNEIRTQMEENQDIQTFVQAV